MHWAQEIPPSYTLAMCRDPELAIARARANRDHDAHHNHYLVFTYPDHGFSQNHNIIKNVIF